MTPRYTLDGGPAFSFAEFVENNEGLGQEDLNAVANLQVGESVSLGGGACAESVIHRIA